MVGIGTVRNLFAVIFLFGLGRWAEVMRLRSFLSCCLKSLLPCYLYLSCSSFEERRFEVELQRCTDTMLHASQCAGIKQGKRLSTCGTLLSCYLKYCLY